MMQVHHHKHEHLIVTRQTRGRWILLIHQIPTNPPYLRVKIGRRLAKVGAVALKNSVYVLPLSEAAFEDFQWLRREIVEQGGDATVVEAEFVEGLSDENAEDLFRNARDVEYSELAEELRALNKKAKGKLNQALRSELESEALRLERRLQEITAVDFFGASGRETVAGLLGALRARIAPPEAALPAQVEEPREAFIGRTWVTRTGIHIDRIGSAWLIRKSIDPKAEFKFVPAKCYVPEPGELRFDMFDAEFSHVGDSCTFEVLCQRFNIREPELLAIAEVIHDIDLKDQKYGRAETEGVAALIAGIALSNREDLERLKQGSMLFEALLAHFSKKRS
jgi:hypothetical protein